MKSLPVLSLILCVSTLASARDHEFGGVVHSIENFWLTVVSFPPNGGENVR